MKSLVAVLALVAAPAFADVVIDFEGLSAGQQVGDYYPGMHFQGVVTVDPTGNKYVHGGTLTFEQPTLVTNMTFTAVGTGTLDPSYAKFTSAKYGDSVALDGVKVSYDNGQWSYGSMYDAMHTYHWMDDTLPITKVTFEAIYLDNIHISMKDPAPTDPSPVPIPGTGLLLGAGLLAYRLRR